MDSAHLVDAVWSRLYDEMKATVENLAKELTMERNWRMRLQEELWELDPSRDPRRQFDGRDDE